MSLKQYIYINIKQLLTIIWSYICMMCNNNNDSETDTMKKRKSQIYQFRPLHFEEIKPENWKIPLPRSGHRIGADSANFYSFGGYNPLVRNDGIDIEDENSIVESFPLFQELWKFNFASKNWMRYPNSHTMPLELASNALLLHRNFLMVYGGTGSPFGFRCSNQLFVCRVNDSRGIMVEVQTTGQLPLPLYGQALIYHNDYLYTIGGTTGLSYTCDIHRLNMKTLTWEIVYVCTGKENYEPAGRYRHEVGFDDHNIYVLGGGTADAAYDFHDIPVFNLERRLWHPQRTLRDSRRGIPAPRRCHGAVQLRNSITGHVEVFITGGHDGETMFDDLWRLDLRTNRWTYFDTCRLPRPTYFHATATSPEGRLFVFGGIYSYDARRSNRIYSTWLSIPKLSEICWEAVLYYSPHIVKCKSDQLIDAGLPRHFVQRLTA